MKQKIPSTADVFLADGDGGFKIYVSTYGNFMAFQGDTSLSAKTMDELKELIKEHLREARRFRPIDVIDVSDDMIGRITSRVANAPDSRVYFTRKDRNDQSVRTEENVVTSHWGREKSEYCFVKKTESNLTILESIKHNKALITELEQKNEQLRKQYTEPITHEVIEAQAKEATKK